MRVSEYDAASVMTEMLITNDPTGYVDKGIGDTLIPMLPRLLGYGKVCSSSAKHPRFAHETRNAVGSAMWERLTEGGRARYEESEDRYWLG